MENEEVERLERREGKIFKESFEGDFLNYRTEISDKVTEDNLLNSHEIAKESKLMIQESNENNSTEKKSQNSENSPHPIKVQDIEKKSLKPSSKDPDKKKSKSKNQATHENILKFSDFSKELKELPEKSLKEIPFSEELTQKDYQRKNSDFFEHSEQFESIFNSEVKNPVYPQ